LYATIPLSERFEGSKMKKIVLLVVLLSGFVFANENLDAQIAAIESASEDKRVELMNELKTQIMNLNENERQSALAQIKEHMHVRGEGMHTEHSMGANHNNHEQMIDSMHIENELNHKESMQHTNNKEKYLEQERSGNRQGRDNNSKRH
jgi:hypothetical protein